MHAKLQRATILTGVLTVLVLACFGTSKAAQFQDSDRFRDTEIFTVDVAVDVSTGAAILSNGGPNRGSTFIIDGKIFRGGALPKGAGMGDPNMPGSIGSWICKGFFTSREGTEDVGYDTTQMFEFNGDRDAIWTEGLEPGLGKQGVITHRTILGGTGRFRGAQGEVKQESLGTNQSGAPNVRMTFKLQRNH